ncbi:8-oxo-dGTP pyrophosphatase MutT, NUDIX family [Chitinophaga costaii]|uniref:GDP-mannose pyrophosphatase n=1 Tax=Chitinophaga costaii TaxID=1335309 RepID=A0A1C3YWA8_9BACT|nr:NUDIX hydrolase [Chitinophaga costaii]PUZ30127.1 NUDIX hydrolase [Chitinophaga costaii]SCB74333.1 8-oxo-dGTP pyrophosphatase MutT, NUDIX family [Chitinophaga costaii]
MENHENPWTLLSEKIAYDNNWIRVTEHQVLNPAGNPGIYGVVHFKNVAIGIVALDAADHIFLVGQYRFPLRQYSWEIPEGGGPVGTDPLASAKRELLEETGLVAASWTHLLHMHLSNSVSDEDCYIFLAQDLSQHEASPEETEQLHVQKLPFDVVYDKVVKEEITDAITVAAVLKMKLWLLDRK